MVPEPAQPNRPLIVGVVLATSLVAVWGLIGGGVLRSGGSVVFWLAIAAGLWGFGAIGTGLVDRTQPSLSATRLVALGTVAAVVVVFDPVSADVFGITKLAVLVVGTVTAVVMWLSRPGRLAGLGSARPLHWAVLALLGWTVLSTVASSDVPLSVLGVRGTHMGLLTTLAVVAIYFVAVASFEHRHAYGIVRALFYPLGGIVLTYGLLQLHDRVWGGSWDWVAWGPTDFDSRIWSTVGNPNHLGALLAMLLPLGLAVLRLERRPLMRALAACMLTVLIVQLLHTQSRGAWGAAAAALLTVGISWRGPLLRAGRRGAVVAAAVLVAVVLAVAFVEASANLGEELRTVVDMDTSTNSQRLGQWKASIDMVQDHPLTGLGPDTFRLHWTRYQPADFVDRFGPYNMTDGSHSIFTDYLSMLGVPGLAALLAVLAIAVREGRLVRASQLEGSEGEKTTILMGAVGAGAVAFVVQAAFNLQQISLWLVFWMLLAVVAILRKGPNPTDNNRLRRARVTPRERRRRVVLGFGAAVLVLLVLVVSLAPWRAARHHRRAVLIAAAVEERPDDPQAAEMADLATAEWDSAIALNPFEPSHPDRSAAFWSLRATNFRLGDPRSALDEAMSDADRAVNRRPLSWELLKDRAAILRQSYDFDPTRSALEAAIDAYERALARNPLDREIRRVLEELRSRRT